MPRTLLKKGMRELWHSKLLYFFLVLTLGMGIASYNSFHNLADSRSSSFDRMYEECLFMDYQAKLGYGAVVNESDAMAILDQAGITARADAIEARLSFDVFINHTSSSGATITRGIVLGYKAFTDDGSPRWPAVNRPLFYESPPARFSAPDARECYIEHAFAKHHGLGAGDMLTVVKGAARVPLKVIDDVNVPEYISVVEEGGLFPNERSLGILMVPLATARSVLSGNASGTPVVNDLAIRLSGPDADAGSDIEKAFEGRGIPVKVTDRESNPARKFLKEDIESDSEMIAVFPGVIFSISGFGLFMALRRMIQTHRSQIGVFKALGVPDRVTVQYFATIGLLVGLLGVAAGLLLTYPLDLFFHSMLVRMLDLAVVEYNGSFMYYLQSAFLAVALCAVCAILPAVSAMRMRPVDAIQTREGVLRQKRSALGSRLDETHHLPVPVKLSVRNLLRKPTRTLSTVLSVALSLALFLSMIIIVDTMRALVDKGGEANLWDYEVTADGFLPQNVTAGWAGSIGNISGQNPGMRLPTLMKRGGSSEAALVFALSDVRASYKVELAGGTMRPGEMVISEYLSGELAAGVGDTVRMEVPRARGQAGFEMAWVNITVSGIHSNHIGYVVFTDLSTLAGFCNLTGFVNLVHLRTVGDERSVGLENALMTTPGVSSVTHVSDQSNMIAQYIDIFMEVVYIVAVVSTVLAMAIVYNLFMISAAEKRREYATMKTLGTSTGRIGNLVAFEALYIMLMGIPLGAAGGYFLARYMILGGGEFAVLNLEPVFSWGGFLAGALMILGVVALVSCLTVRYIGQINIANVIRERSY